MEAEFDNRFAAFNRPSHTYQGMEIASMDSVTASELSASIGNFLIPLRTGEGFSVEHYDALCKALRDFGTEWASSDVIPKAIASACIDLLVVVESSQELYHGDERKRIAGAGGTLFDLVQSICEMMETQ